MDPTTTAHHVHAGVDVSKERLDVSIRRGEAAQQHASFGVTNDDPGIDALVARLAESTPGRLATSPGPRDA